MLSAMLDLSGRNAVVTGGGRGLGRGITEALLDAGATVTVLQRSPVPDDLAVRGVSGFGVDLADPEAAATVAADVLAAGDVDILVNNAGIQFRTPAVDYPVERFDEMLSVHLRSVFRLCQVFGRPMLERGWGRIVNVASVLSVQGGVFVPGYAAAKGGVVQLTKALCNEWAPGGVTVNAIAPGYMETDMTEALVADPDRSVAILERIPAGRWGTPADLGAMVAFLASDAAAYVNGVMIPVDGGWLSR